MVNVRRLYTAPARMNVLVACEYSGTVREAFAARGHNAWSCDLLPSDKPGQHYQCDVLEVAYSKSMHWDLMIAHPPCTHLAVSGATHFAAKLANNPRIQLDALQFVLDLMNAPIARICIENPVSIISSRIRKPDQCIQPWQFGHGETKKTCLWLKGLPLLQPTNVVDGRSDRMHKMPPSVDRWKLRSTTYEGIARAFAEQWG